eukprot:5561888-Amphidinium_carterae.1
MLAGAVPSEVRPWLMGGNLAVLKKPGGSGHRPIAVGKNICWLCCKVASASAIDEIQDYMRKIQFGVGVGSGCEGIVVVNLGPRHL